MSVDYDVGIIGGGPAGSAMACYLAKAGVKCVVFEREIFPREHVGESLVPSSTRVFKELDFLRVMEEKKFLKKYGAAWTANPKVRPYRMDWEGLDMDCRADIRFDERAQSGIDQNYTYHVDRAEFDLALLKHAHEAGAEVIEGIHVRRVEGLEGGGDPEIRFQLGSKELSTKVRLVIDASGRKTLLGNQLKLKVKDPVFDQYALHTWFEGWDRGPDPEGSYIHIHFLPIVNTWVWQIPIREHVTSVGVVTQRKNFAASKAERDDFFWSALRARPDLAARADKARALRPLKEEGDYSYAMREFTGDRFLLLGDAARFVDPIFSTGVSIALNSARFASKDVVEALSRGKLEKASYDTFASTTRRGVKNWYDFISVYYRLNVLFTYFVSNPKTRLDVLKLLQGDVYDEDQPEVLTKMREMVREVEENPKHMWHEALGELTSESLRDPGSVKLSR